MSDDVERLVAVDCLAGWLAGAALPQDAILPLVKLDSVGEYLAIA